MADWERAEREVLHGRLLSGLDAETIWGWRTPAGRVRARRRGQRISAGARLAPGLRALEIGCGTGLFTEMFATTGASIVAIDISPHLLERAHGRELPAGQVQFLACPLEECDHLGPFDAVIGSSVLHHMHLRSALERIHRLLKPGGWLSFAEPNMLNPQVFVERALRHCRPVSRRVLEHEMAYVRGRLRAELQWAGFNGIDIRPMDWLHPRIPRGAIPTVTRLEAVLERIPLVRELAGSLYLLAQKAEANDQ